MKQRKIPLRTCVVTNEKLPKRELLRIVNNKELGVLVDETGKVNGRGVYLKKDLAVLEKAKKSNILGRRLETEINNEIYDQIKEVIEKFQKSEVKKNDEY